MTDQPAARLVHAPWSAEQVTALNAFQHAGRMHPFTCGAEHASRQSPVLVATNGGWVCPDPQCTYRQDWAHAFMAVPVVPVSSPPPDQTALERVRAMHQPVEGLGYDSDEDDTPGSYGRIAQACSTCGTSDEYAVRWPCATVRAIDEELRRLAAEAQQPDTETPVPAEAPARIDRLRPEFTDHASIESIDTQLRRARTQERRWHLRTEWLIGLRQVRVEQKARGEWPATTPEPPPVHKGGNADDCPACIAGGLDTIGPPYECTGPETGRV